MGVQESHEDANSTLNILWKMKDEQVEYALEKLEHLSKDGYQMQVNKWDLLIFTKMEASELKQLVKMLTGEKEPTKVGIHQVMLSLVLSRTSKWTMARQVQKLVDMISFTLNPEEIQLTEFQYLAHLMYHQIKVITHFELKASSMETSVIDFVFKGAQESQISDLVTFMAESKELLLLFTIFTKVPISQHRKERMMLSKVQKKKEFCGASRDTSLCSEQSQIGEVQVEEESQDLRKSGEKPGLQKAKESKLSNPSAHNSKAALVVKTVQSLTFPDEDIPKSPLNDRNQDPAYQQLQWNTNILQYMELPESASRQIFDSKLTQDFNKQKIFRLLKEKIANLRYSSNKNCNYENAQRISEQSLQLQMVENSCLDFYGSQQMNIYLRAYTLENTLSSNKFSIKEFIGSREGENECPDNVKFDQVMQRELMSQLFKLVFQQHLPQLRYEAKIYEARIVHQMLNRGKRREMEKQKSMLLGEIRVLCDVLDEAEIYLKHRETCTQHKIVIQNLDTIEESQENDIRFHRGIPVQMQDKLEYGKQSPNLGRASRGKSPGTHTPSGHQKLYPPNMDIILHRVSREYSKIRNNNMSRKDLIQFSDIKRQKWESKRMIGFWQGVKKSLEYVCQIKTFSELEYFHNAWSQMERALAKEERAYTKILEQHKEMKQNMRSYFKQLGKLKSIVFIMDTIDRDEFSAEKQGNIENVQKFIGSVQQNLTELTQKMEAVDIELVKGTAEQVLNNRSNILWFKVQGQLSTYNCIKKAIDFSSIFDYLAKVLAKVRIWETSTLSCQTSSRGKLPSAETRHEQTVELLSVVFNLKFLFRYDKQYNRDEIDFSEMQFQYDRFIDEIKEDAEEEKKMAFDVREMPDIGLFYRADLIKDSTKKMVRSFLLQFYKRVCPKAQAAEKWEEYNDFVREGLENGCNENINSSFKFQNYDIEDAGNCFFDFVELEEYTHLYSKDEFVNEQGDTIVHWMGTLSISLRHFDMKKKCASVRSQFQKGHKNCQQFLTELQQTAKEKNFRAVIRTHVKRCIKRMVQLIFELNTNTLINGMDSIVLSLPLEYSPIVNLNLIHALNRKLKEMEIQHRIGLKMMNRPDLIERRQEHFLKFTGLYQCMLGALVTGATLDELQPPSDRLEIIEKQVRSLESDEKMTAKMNQEIFGGLAEILIQLERQARLEVQECSLIVDVDRTWETDAISYHLAQQDAPVDMPRLLQEYEDSRHFHQDYTRQLMVQDMFAGGRRYMEEVGEKWNWNGSVVVEKFLKYTKIVESQFDSRVEAMNTSIEQTSRNLESAEKQVIEQLVRSKFITELKHIAEKSHPSHFLDRVARIKSRKGKYLQRLKIVSDFLMANCINEIRVEVRSSMPEIGDQGLRGRKLCFEIYNSHKVQNWFLYKPWKSGDDDSSEGDEGSPTPMESQPQTQAQKLTSILLREITEKSEERKGTPMDGLQATFGVKDAKELSHARHYFLTPAKIAANMFVNYLGQAAIIDLRNASILPRRTDRLFLISQLLKVEVDHHKDEICLNENLKKSFEHLIDVYQIEKSSLDIFKQRYVKVGKFVQGDLQKQFEEQDEGQLQFQFFTIMSQKGSALLKQYYNRIESFLWLMDLEDEDKVAGTIAVDYFQSMIKKRLVPFKLFIDNDQSIKAVENHVSKAQFRKLRMYQEISVMISFIRIYYLKKDQDRCMQLATDVYVKTIEAEEAEKSPKKKQRNMDSPDKDDNSIPSFSSK